MNGPSAKPPYTLGIDIGGTKIYAVVLDADNKILARAKKKTAEGTPGVILTRMLAAAEECVGLAGLTHQDIQCAGVGFPGPLDLKTGTILLAANLPEWSGFPLSDEASRVLKCPVFVDNDVNLGTYGEAILGAGHGAPNVVGIFLGTGVGGGIILNGKIYHGATGTAGEIGHTIVRHGGPIGPFGLKGSLEGLTSRTALIRFIRRQIKKGKKSSLEPLLKSGKRIGSMALSKAYRQRDPVVVMAFRRTATYLGSSVGSIINFLAPDVIILGGGLVEAVPEGIMPLTRKVAMKVALSSNRAHCKIEEAALGDDAGAVGAALYARQRIQEVIRPARYK